MPVVFQAKRFKRLWVAVCCGNRQRPQELKNLIIALLKSCAPAQTVVEPKSGERYREGHPKGCVLLILEKLPENTGAKLWH
jgi:hypothetical protein